MKQQSRKPAVAKEALNGANDIRIPRQPAGAVAGAVVGAVVAGPIGAAIGGVVGTLRQAHRGKRDLGERMQESASRVNTPVLESVLRH